MPYLNQKIHTLRGKQNISFYISKDLSIENIKQLFIIVQMALPQDIFVYKFYK